LTDLVATVSHIKRTSTPHTFLWILYCKTESFDFLSDGTCKIKLEAELLTKPQECPLNHFFLWLSSPILSNLSRATCKIYQLVEVSITAANPDKIFPIIDFDGNLPYKPNAVKTVSYNWTNSTSYQRFRPNYIGITLIKFSKPFEDDQLSNEVEFDISLNVKVRSFWYLHHITRKRHSQIITQGFLKSFEVNFVIIFTF
jgi:hypothetical protein